jgi:hypothetical protein
VLIEHLKLKPATSEVKEDKDFAKVKGWLRGFSFGSADWKTGSIATAFQGSRVKFKETVAWSLVVQN